MREIIFRGRLKDTANYHYVGWVYGSLVYSPSEDHYYIIEHCDNELSYPVDKETMGQFTGVCDKNGTKIFEGDIVNIIYEEYPIENCVVVFGDYNVFRNEWGHHYSTCGFALKFADGSGYTILTRKNIYEVIGNIHDNPELLGESDDN